MSDFIIYAQGVVMTSVCSSLSLEETTRRLNIESPTGIAHAWEPAEDETFRTGQPNPCPCDQNPETHKHYLFER